METEGCYASRRERLRRTVDTIAVLDVSVVTVVLIAVLIHFLFLMDQYHYNISLIPLELLAVVVIALIATGIAFWVAYLLWTAAQPNQQVIKLSLDNCRKWTTVTIIYWVPKIVLIFFYGLISFSSPAAGLTLSLTVFAKNVTCLRLVGKFVGELEVELSTQLGEATSSVI